MTMRTGHGVCFIPWRALSIGLKTRTLRQKRILLNLKKTNTALMCIKKAILTLCILTINRCLPPIDFICYRLCRRIGSWILCI